MNGKSALSFALVFFCVSLCHGTSNQDAHWRRGLFRVNTDVSSGLEGVNTVVAKARTAGYSFVVFSDQFLVRAEYGLPPFRNVLKTSKSQNSVVSFGVDNYLNMLARVREKNPDMVIISGVDVAPFYYWTGSPFKKTLTANQFSEQLTVFGPVDADFYRDLPVIHNERPNFHFFSNLFKMSPLMACVAGIMIMVAGKRRHYYADAQGNKYYKSQWPRRFIACFLIIAGVVWCVDNKPFRSGTSLTPYQDLGAKPYQELIDHIRTRGGEQVGIVWSAPEATMKVTIANVDLISVPYVDDIKNTYGYNGFPAIYGDVGTMHEIGAAWDKLLAEYCSGSRDVRPIAVGEEDYHGRGRRIDHIQTVVRTKTLDYKNIMDALLSGCSYAVATEPDGRLFVRQASLECENQVARIGDTLRVDEKKEVVFRFQGGLETSKASKKQSARLEIVLDGKLLVEKMLEESDRMTCDVAIPASKLKKGKGYVRFTIRSAKFGWLAANPIFYQID